MPFLPPSYRPALTSWIVFTSSSEDWGYNAPSREEAARMWAHDAIVPTIWQRGGAQTWETPRRLRKLVPYTSTRSFNNRLLQIPGMAYTSRRPNRFEHIVSIYSKAEYFTALDQSRWDDRTCRILPRPLAA